MSSYLLFILLFILNFIYIYYIYKKDYIFIFIIAFLYRNADEIDLSKLDR